MDGVVNVESVLQNLPGAGVDHGPLLDVSRLLIVPKPRQTHTRVGASEGTQEMKTILLLKSKGRQLALLSYMVQDQDLPRAFSVT
jgi:hypothetical protein